jgi:Carboxypeptidase regulatory-like domain
MPRWSRSTSSAAAMVGIMFLACEPIFTQVRPPQQTAARTGTFRVTGTIVNVMNGAPLGRARVSLVDVRTGSQGVSVVTSEDGRFEFAALPAGKFSLQGAKRGFLPGAYEQHLTFSTAIVTGGGVDTENLILRLTPLARLSGKILDESGEPVRSAVVTLYEQENREGLGKIEFAGRVATDDQGSYEFATLDPGTYFLCAMAKPWYAVHPPSFHQNGSANNANLVDPSLDVAYPPTLFNGATDSDAATPISLKGGDRQHVDIHMGPVPAMHIVIRMAARNDAAGYAMPMFQKRIFEFMDFVQPESTEAVPPDSVEVTGIPAGKYTMQIRGGGLSSATRRTEVNLQSGAEEIDLSKSESMAAVKVSLKYPNGEPLPANLWVGLQDVRAQFIAGQQVDQDGTTTLGDVPPGKYTVIVGGEQGRYSVAHMISGGKDISMPQISVAAVKDVDLTVFITRGVVAVEGFVKRSGKPVPGAMVVLVPKDADLNPDSVRRDQSDLDGSFVVRDVVPGTYTLIAVEDGWDIAWRQSSALNGYLAHGQQLTIGPLMRGSVLLPQAVEPMK